MKQVLLLLLTSSLCTAAQTPAADSSKAQSSITYTIVHPLHTYTATSKDAVFHLDADPVKKKIKSVSASVDVMTFDSGNSNRDSHAMEAIEALTYPEASFASTALSQNGDSLTVTGTLTFHGVAKVVAMSGTAKWSVNRLDVEETFTISLTEFNIERPSLLMLPVHDEIPFTVTATISW